VVWIHFTAVSRVARVVGGVSAAVVHVTGRLVRGAVNVRGGAISVFEELLVLRLDLLGAAHHAHDAAAHALARLLGLVTIVSGVRSTVIAHDAGLLRDVAEVVRLVPPELLNSTCVVEIAILVVAAGTTANASIARELVVASCSVAKLRITLFDLYAGLN
jgi:hypothetical protein